VLICARELRKEIEQFLRHGGSGIADRVARLAFLRPNSRNLAFLKVVWHEKVVFGMYVIVWHCFGLF